MSASKQGAKSRPSSKSELSRERHTCQKCGKRKHYRNFRMLNMDHGGYNPVCLRCEHDEGLIPDKPEYQRQYSPTKEDRVKARIQRELMRREMARRRLIPFVKRFESGYQDGWIHHKIAYELEQFYEQVKRGEEPRLMLFIPPRHGKTLLASDYFPSWVLGKDPQIEIIASSYSVGLPTKASRRIKDRIQKEAFQAVFPETKLHKHSQNVEMWKTTQEGGFLAAGVGGGITGHGSHIFIIDDPIKDAEEADSEVTREGVWDWWSAVASTRVAPGGGVLVIQCMTGDTPVLMEGGGHRRLDEIRPGDYVMSWKDGEAVPRRVLNWANQGCDSVFSIKTSSGSVVRANARHPFLVYEYGEYRWVRVRDLKLGQRIVTKRDSGASGRGSSVHGTGASAQSFAGGTASPTTTSGGGIQATARRLLKKTLDLVSAPSSNIGTALRSMTTSGSWLGKAGYALFAAWSPRRPATLSTGTPCCASTTAMIPALYEDSCVTGATSQLEGATPPNDLKLQQTTFAGDTITAIEPAGCEEVFDIEVEDTHNFVADVMVVSNTRWHDDDLSGRLIQQMKEAEEEGIPDEEIEKWRILSFPAIAEDDEWELSNGEIREGTPTDAEIHQGAQFIRGKGAALHEDRWPLRYLKKKRRSMMKRHWAALYQQNPVPDEGIHFTTDMMVPRPRSSWPMSSFKVLAAFDLAIGEKSHNDWTVGVVGGIDHRGKLHIFDMLRGQWGTFEIVEAILAVHRTWRPLGIGIETGQLEMAIDPVLRQRCQETNTYPILDRTLRPIVDKQRRASPLQGMMEHHRVLFPDEHDAPWVRRMKEELLRFPAGRNDDIVDALAWLARMALKTQPPGYSHTQKKQKSWKDKIHGYNRKGKSPMAA